MTSINLKREQLSLDVHENSGETRLAEDHELCDRMILKDDLPQNYILIQFSLSGLADTTRVLSTVAP